MAMGVMARRGAAFVPRFAHAQAVRRRDRLKARLLQLTDAAMTESLFAARLRSRLVVRHPSSAKRSLGLRYGTWFPVQLHLEQGTVRCQAVQVSASGIVLEHRGGFQLPDHPVPLRLELLLSPQLTITVLARPVRRFDEKFCALKFVAISDVDRLSLMEHLDREERETQRCLDALVAAGKPLS